MKRLIVVTAIAVPLVFGCVDRRTEGPPDVSSTEGLFGVAPSSAGGIPSVITLTPITPTTGEGIAIAQTPVMDQFGLAFSPREMFVSIGRSVRFTNSEGALAHNVQVRSIDRGIGLFDADTNAGEAVVFEFTEEGGYDVSCETHPGMTAFIYATSSPYSTFADQDGSFRFTGVPPGEYSLTVWHSKAALRSEQWVTIGIDPTEIQVASSR